MKWQLFRWKDATRRELEFGPIIEIPEERDCPDIILHKAVLYHYSENGGIFIEADTYDTDKQE